MTETLDRPETTAFEVLMNSVLDRMPRPRKEYAAFVDSLSQRERHLLVLTCLNSQVCNGGFSQWVDNGHQGRDTTVVLLALERMQAKTTGRLAFCVAQVLDLVKLAIRHVANCDDPEQLTDEEFEYLDRLDHGYYVLSDEFWPLVKGYFLNWIE